RWRKIRGIIDRFLVSAGDQFSGGLGPQASSKNGGRMDVPPSAKGEKKGIFFAGGGPTNPQRNSQDAGETHPKNNSKEGARWAVITSIQWKTPNYGQRLMRPGLDCRCPISCVAWAFSKSTSVGLRSVLFMPTSIRPSRCLKARTAKAGSGSVTSVAAMAMKSHFW